MFHGYCRVDGGYLDMTAAEVLHDHVARQHGSDLIIGGQRLVRQRRITRAQYPIISEINVELFLHGRFDIDFGQNAKSLGFERLDDAFYYGREASTHGFRDIIFHLNTSSELGPRSGFEALGAGALEKMAPSPATMRYFAQILCVETFGHGFRRRIARTTTPTMSRTTTSPPIPPKPPIPQPIPHPHPSLPPIIAVLPQDHSEYLGQESALWKHAFPPKMRTRPFNASSRVRLIGWRVSAAINPVEHLLHCIVARHASLVQGFAYRIEHCRFGFHERSVVGHGMPVI